MYPDKNLQRESRHVAARGAIRDVKCRSFAVVSGGKFRYVRAIVNTLVLSLIIYYILEIGNLTHSKLSSRLGSKRHGCVDSCHLTVSAEDG